MEPADLFADAVIRWTARLFVICYVARTLIDASHRHDPSSQRFARWIWTNGCGIYVLHVAAAFHLMHGWSHAAAYNHVSARTYQMTGIASGFGLYINYAFGVVWIADTLMWWKRLDWSEQRIPYWVVQGLFAFLISQATVVFGPWFWPPLAVIYALALVTASFFKAPPFRGRMEAD